LLVVVVGPIVTVAVAVAVATERLQTKRLKQDKCSLSLSVLEAQAVSLLRHWLVLHKREVILFYQLLLLAQRLHILLRRKVVVEVVLLMF
jgi:hypothetical protein